MSLFAALILAQASGVIGTVPTPSPELDAAHACVTTGADRMLGESRSKPGERERWKWAAEIVRACEAEIKAAADAPSAVHVFAYNAAHGSITKRDTLRAEATYYVDRLIREHFEGQRQ